LLEYFALSDGASRGLGGESSCGGLAELVRAAGDDAGVEEFNVRVSLVRASLAFCGEDCRGVCDACREDAATEPRVGRRGLLRGLGNAFRVCGSGDGLCGGPLLRFHGSGLLDGGAAMQEARTEKNRDERQDGYDAERKVIELGNGGSKGGRWRWG